MKIILPFLLLSLTVLLADQTEEDRKQAYVEKFKNRKLSGKVIESIKSSSTSELISSYISATPNSPLVSKAALDELTKNSRKSALIEGVKEILKQETLSPEETRALPELARCVSSEFEIEVLKAAVFHPFVANNANYNKYFLGSREWRAGLKKSPKVMEQVFNDLVKQGRLVEGEPAYKAWSKDLKKLLNRNEGSKQTRPRHKASEKIQNQLQSTSAPQKETSKITSENKSEKKWFVSIAVTLLFIGLFIWIKLR